MRAARLTMPLKTAAADRLVVGAAFLVVLLAASLVAAIPIYADAVAESSLRARLERAPLADRNAQLVVDVFSGVAEPKLDAHVTALVQDTFGGTPVTIFRSGESEPFSADDRTIAFGFFDDLESHATLLSGHWPATRSSPIEVVVPAVVAAELGFEVGDVVDAASRVKRATTVTAIVVGTYRADRPASPFWWAHPLATGGEGPLVTTRETFSTLGLADQNLRWRLAPDASGLTIGEASRLRVALDGLGPGLNQGRPAGQQFEVQTNLPRVLADAEHSLHLARAGVLVPFIQLALLALYGLVVTTALLLERRFRVTETLRLRGGTALQITTMALVEATLIAVPAVVLAPWLAAGSLRALNHVGPLADVGVHLEPRVSATSYLLAVAAGIVCALGLALPALRARRVSVARERRRPVLAGLAQRAKLDLVVAVLALLGYWQLRRYHGTLVSHQGSLGIDPFLVAAPAVLLLAGALLSLRLVPLVAALAERLAGSSRGAVSSLGFRSLSRRPRTYSRSVLLLVLAVAIGVFATTYASTWHRSQLDQAAHTAGADVRVDPSGVIGAPPTIDLSTAYRAVGAVEALPIVTDDVAVGGKGAEGGTLLALDAHRAEGVVHVRDDLSSRSLGDLFRPLAESGGSLASLPLPGRPTRLSITARVSFGPAPKDAPNREYVARASLAVYLRDADGLLYLERLGTGNGPGALVPGRMARFETNLVERSVPRYPLAVVALELDVPVPYLSPRHVTLGPLRLQTSGATGPWRSVQLGGGWYGFAPRFKGPYVDPGVRTVSTAGGTLHADVTTGSSWDPFGSSPGAQFFLRPGRDTLPAAPSVLASDAFLAATSSIVDETIPVAFSTGTRQVRIVGSFRRFPSLDPATPALVADLPTYLALSFADQQAVLQPSEWWLDAPDDRSVAERLRAAPFRSIDVVSRTETEDALLDDPVALGVIGALALGFVVAAIFAAAGFAASAAAEARSRMVELAVLRSLGLRRQQLTGLIGLESSLVVASSLLGGAVLGLAVSWLVLPYVGLGASGATPVPPVRLVVPWRTVLLLELALLGVLVGIAAVQVEVVRRLRLAPVLRGGEGMPAP